MEPRFSKLLCNSKAILNHNYRFDKMLPFLGKSNNYTKIIKPIVYLI